MEDDSEFTRLTRVWRARRPVFRETEKGTSHAAYTENKGDVIAICLRKPRDLNALTFVLVHELAHIANASWGHDDNFWKLFRSLLDYAERMGLYEPVESDARVCGVNLSI